MCAYQWVAIIVVCLFVCCCCQVVEVEIEDGSEDSEAEEDRLLTTPVGTARQRLGVTGTAAVVNSHTPTLCEYGSTPDYSGGQTQ